MLFGVQILQFDGCLLGSFKELLLCPTCVNHIWDDDTTVIVTSPEIWEAENTQNDLVSPSENSTWQMGNHHGTIGEPAING